MVTESRTKTGADVKYHITRLFGDEASVQLTDRDLLEFINRAQQEIVLNNYELNRAMVEGTIEAESNEISLSDIDDCLRLYAIMVDGKLVQNFSLQEALRYRTDNPDLKNAYPTAWYKFDDFIRLIPATDKTYSYEVWYDRRPQDLESLEDSLDVSDQSFSQLLDWVLKYCYEMDEDYQKAQAKADDIQRGVQNQRMDNLGQHAEHYAIRSFTKDDEEGGVSSVSVGGEYVSWSGTDGRSIVSGYVNSEGTLRLKDDGGNTIIVEGSLKGPKGDPGTGEAIDPSAILSQAASYSDDRLVDANNYSDAKLVEAETYSDGVLLSAKSYADGNKVEALSYSDAKLVESKAYTDSKSGYIGPKLNGSSWLIVGDSISTRTHAAFNGQHYSVLAPSSLNGKLRFTYRTAVSGNNSAQQLSAVTSYLATNTSEVNGLTLATVMVGTNDIRQGVSKETWLSNINSIVSLLKGKNISPVLFTIPPRSGPTNPTPPSQIKSWNEGLKDYCRVNNIPVVDIWAAVTGKNGEWRNGLGSPVDGVHPTPVGMEVMSSTIADTLDAILVSPSRYGKEGLVPDHNGVEEITGGGTESVVTSSALPVSWIKPASTTISFVPDAMAPGGHAVEINSPITGNRQVYLDKRTGLTINSGDKIRGVARVRILNAAGVPVGYGLSIIFRFWTDGSTYVDVPQEISGINAPSSEYRDYVVEAVAPSALTGVSFYAQTDKGDASAVFQIRVAGLAVYNLTALGRDYT